MPQVRYSSESLPNELVVPSRRRIYPGLSRSAADPTSAERGAPGKLTGCQAAPLLAQANLLLEIL